MKQINKMSTYEALEYLRTLDTLIASKNIISGPLAFVLYRETDKIKTIQNLYKNQIKNETFLCMNYPKSPNEIKNMVRNIYQSEKPIHEWECLDTINSYESQAFTNKRILVAKAIIRDNNAFYFCKKKKDYAVTEPNEFTLFGGRVEKEMNANLSLQETCVNTLKREFEEELCCPSLFSFLNSEKGRMALKHPIFVVSQERPISIHNIGIIYDLYVPNDNIERIFPKEEKIETFRMEYEEVPLYLPRIDSWAIEAMSSFNNIGSCVIPKILRSLE